MSILLGFVILYGAPAGFAYLFWTAVARLAGYWTGRDVMLGFIPKAHDVHVMEKLLGIRTRITPDRT